MNLQRILLGGLLAGVVIAVSEGILNGVVIADQYQAALTRAGITEAPWAMTAYIGTCFILGFVLAWLYAAIRPRLGAGWTTGAQAGIVTWIVATVVPTVWLSAIGLTLGSGATMLVLVWGLVEQVLAGVVAGWAYKEAGADMPAATASSRPGAAASV